MQLQFCLYFNMIYPLMTHVQNIKMQGNEWTGNVIARQGRIYLYTSNPSSPMQIDYVDGPSKTEIFCWIEAFVAAKRLSGSLCFDFMEHPVTGETIRRLNSNL